MKLNSPNIYLTELRFDDIEFQPEVDTKVIQSLSYLLGQDKTSNKFHPVSVDSDGNLQIDLTSNPVSSISMSQVTIATTVTTIVSANSTRKRLLIRNTGLQTVSIGGDNTVTYGNGFLLAVGEQLELDNFTGALYGISNTGSNDISLMTG